ncbi:MAG: organoarsenical effux MFS transporter ArsJ [Marivibrio sp.]|uniref:organoarsenical effux MFS transporter ArsJ n=1 Tax=Marivibrio sp. TaxID=2039719 RepID=UPI0032EC1B6B
MTADRRSYAAVTAAYWGFTLTDGALRMLVLLHFHALGFTPLDLAFLFLLYEAMGVVTNFFGGWIGARYGLRLTLYLGLATQIVALTALSFVSADWALGLSVAYVMGAQALSGVAKDLTKMSSKSAVKLVVADEAGDGASSPLFKLVALLTGSKNALKGVGFFLGGLLLETLGFQAGLWLMAGALALVLIAALAGIRADLGRAKQKIARRELFAKSRAINILSAARVFLFAARDVWFVVGVPLFLYDVLGWRFDQVGAFMAAWVIGYGIVQAGAPRLIGRSAGAGEAATGARWWGLALAAIPAGLAALLGGDPGEGSSDGAVLIGGLFVFGAVFAVNSSLHSYLIVALSDRDKVALSVGFYYMANAVGRFAGTLLSGLVYQAAGLTACLWVSAAMVAIAAALAFLLRPETPARSQEAAHDG